jgi:hypothetical protein
MYVVGTSLERLFGDPTSLRCDYLAPTGRLVVLGCDGCMFKTESTTGIRHRDSNLECSAALRVVTFAVEANVVYDTSTRRATRWRVVGWQRSTTPRRGVAILQSI